MQSPGYFDLQVNGYGGVDFNSDDLSAESMRKACERLAADCVAGIFATIVTEDLASMFGRLKRIVKLRAADEVVAKMIAGLHIEGPFINETTGYRGAHPADAIHPADLDEAKRLIEAGGGLVRLVTLAPERDANMTVTRWLASQDIVVSAGHTDASLDQLDAACDAGLSMITHLGNGCPAQLPRHDNIVQRGLAMARKKKLRPCFIADGAHVPLPSLGNYIAAVGVDQCIVVTDAIAPAGLGPGRYKLSRWDLLIGPDMVARAPDGSHLVGSACSMPLAEKNLIDGVGLSASDARRLTSELPRRAVGLTV